MSKQNLWKTRSDNFKDNMIGYPGNMDADFTSVLESFEYNLNNCGDPFNGSNYKLNSMEVEQEVLSFFAKLWNIEDNSYWGYITASGTEGNMQGIRVGRERFPTGLLYTSADSHYSIFKIAKLFRMDLVLVKSQENGEMDYQDFERQLNLHKDKPAIVNANIGTTMKGAVDQVDKIHKMLLENNVQYHLHADAALMGLVLPFVYNDLNLKRYINSIAVSGHKFLGVPFPCGIFMMEKELKSFVETEVEYIGSVDATILGSRNGHAPLFMKHIVDKLGMDGFKEQALRCLYLAQWFTNLLKGNNVEAWLNPHSITVVLPKPNQEIVSKWQLASEGDISHVIVMPHVSQQQLLEFLQEYLENLS